MLFGTGLSQLFLFNICVKYQNYQNSERLAKIRFFGQKEDRRNNALTFSTGLMEQSVMLPTDMLGKTGWSVSHISWSELWICVRTKLNDADTLVIAGPKVNIPTLV